MESPGKTLLPPRFKNTENSTSDYRNLQNDAARDQGRGAGRWSSPTPVGHKKEMPRLAIDTPLAAGVDGFVNDAGETNEQAIVRLKSGRTVLPRRAI